MAAALFVGGFAIAPTLIATTSLTEQMVPRTRLVEGMAIVHTGIAGGVAPGAALAGVLIDAAAPRRPTWSRSPVAGRRPRRSGHAAR